MYQRLGFQSGIGRWWNLKMWGPGGAILWSMKSPLQRRGLQDPSLILFFLPILSSLLVASWWQSSWGSWVQSHTPIMTCTSTHVQQERSQRTRTRTPKMWTNIAHPTSPAFLFFRQNLVIYPRLAHIFLCSAGWPQIYNPPAPASQVLDL